MMHDLVLMTLVQLIKHLGCHKQCVQVLKYNITYHKHGPVAKDPAGCNCHPLSRLVQLLLQHLLRNLIDVGGRWRALGLIPILSVSKNKEVSKNIIEKQVDDYQILLTSTGGKMLFAQALRLSCRRGFFSLNNRIVQLILILLGLEGNLVIFLRESKIGSLSISSMPKSSRLLQNRESTRQVNIKTSKLE